MEDNEQNKVNEEELEEVAGGATRKYVYYTVVAGDTLSKIARLSNTTVKTIVRLNPQIKDPNLIRPGWVLKIPA